MEDKIMDVEERKERLSVIVRSEATSRQFHMSDELTAIDTLNKMDNLYKQTVEVHREAIHTFVFVLPDGTKFMPGGVKLLTAPVDSEQTSEAT